MGEGTSWSVDLGLISSSFVGKGVSPLGRVRRASALVAPARSIICSSYACVCLERARLLHRYSLHQCSTSPTGIPRVAGFESHCDQGRRHRSCSDGAYHRDFMSCHLRFCFAAFLLLAGVSTSPASPNPFAALLG